MYTKEFDVRWNDIDANKHLGNSVYIAYMSHTRMSFLEDCIGLDIMANNGLGPIVFYEHIYYFKEIHLGDPVKVSLEVKGHSDDGRFLLMEHNFYNEEVENLAFSEILFSWMNLETRRLSRIPSDLLAKIKSFPRSKDFEILTKEAKKLRKSPKKLDLK